MFSNLPVRRLILLGTPLTLTILMLFHPWLTGSVRENLVPIATWWTILHILQFILFALMGAAIWLLTNGLQGVAVTVSRIGALVFVLCYNIGDAMGGIASGILATSIAAAPSEEQAAATAKDILTLGHGPLTNISFLTGTLGWDVALVSAAVALYRAGAPRVPVLLLALPVLLLHQGHFFPYGSLAFGCFFVIALWLELSSKSSPKPTAQDTE